MNPLHNMGKTEMLKSLGSSVIVEIKKVRVLEVLGI